jgi:hypothetical protein
MYLLDFSLANIKEHLALALGFSGGLALSSWRSRYV